MIRYVLSRSTPREMFLSFVAFLAAIMLAIICHEYAHGYAALKNGDMTAKFAGRLTFNPKVHFNILGIMMFLFVGIGWANPVPVNPNNFRNVKKGMLVVSLAGVTANFVLAFIGFAVLAAINALNTQLLALQGNEFINMILYALLQFSFITVLINISLIAFNLLPIFPLDGFRIVETLTPPNNVYVNFMRRYGVFVLLGLVMMGNLFGGFDIFGTYIGAVRNLILKLFNLIFNVELLV